LPRFVAVRFPAFRLAGDFARLAVVFAVGALRVAFAGAFFAVERAVFFAVVADFRAGAFLRAAVRLVDFVAVLRAAEVVFGAAFFVGSFFRLVEASSSSCFALIDEAMLLEAPLRDFFDVWPRFAERAAPAAICCFLDFAGIPCKRVTTDLRFPAIRPGTRCCQREGARRILQFSYERFPAG
jgi:hypothetical protein